jgi:hypothetical protein
MPGLVLTNIFAPLADWGEYGPPGTVIEEYECTVSNKATPPHFEDEYEYNLQLQEPWNEKEGRIYWLSIEAVFEMGYIPDVTPAFMLPLEHPEWGWKTSNLTNVIDDAVVWRPEGGPPPPLWEELAWPDPGYPWPELFVPPLATYANYDKFIGHDGSNDSVNMAFELLTDICPRRTTKWSQMPDMMYGEDLWSWRYESDPFGSMFLRADDFISDGRLITDIHWGGSYSNWYVWMPGSETNPIPPPSKVPEQRIKFFHLSWHEDAGGVPAEPAITNIFVPIDDCHEMFYGTVTQFWHEPLIFEHEYQYYVDLMDYELGPWPELEGGHYWLNIEAVFHDGFFPGHGGEGHHGWGWKIAEFDPEHPTGILDKPAVTDRTGPWFPDPGSLPTNNPRYLSPPMDRYDMSFELTTTEVSSNSPTLPIVITNTVSLTSNTVHIVRTVGTSGAGTQYLQMNTNLLTNVWTDIPGQTKVAPFPPPIANTWTVTGVTDSNVFYRVSER